MQFHCLSGSVGILVHDCVDDGLVIGDCFRFPAGGSFKEARWNRTLQVPNKPPGTARRCAVDQLVKLMIEFRRFVVTRFSEEHMNVLKFGSLLVGKRRGRHSCHPPSDKPKELVVVDHVGARDFGDERSSTRSDLEQPLFAEHNKTFADRRSADVEVFSYLFLINFLARSQLATQDLVAYMGYDFLGQAASGDTSHVMAADPRYAACT